MCGFVKERGVDEKKRREKNRISGVNEILKPSNEKYEVCFFFLHFQMYFLIYSFKLQTFYF